MSKKQIRYFIDEKGRKPVWDFIQSLSPDEKNKCLEFIDYLENLGEEIRRPIGDYIGNKLYELRPKQNRILYFFMLKDFAVLVHAFKKKTNAIPEKEIQLAIKRMNLILKYWEGHIAS